MVLSNPLLNKGPNTLKIPIPSFCWVFLHCSLKRTLLFKVRFLCSLHPKEPDPEASSSPLSALAPASLIMEVTLLPSSVLDLVHTHLPLPRSHLRLLFILASVIWPLFPKLYLSSVQLKCHHPLEPILSLATGMIFSLSGTHVILYLFHYQDISTLCLPILLCVSLA